MGWHEYRVMLNGSFLLCGWSLALITAYFVRNNISYNVQLAQYEVDGNCHALSVHYDVVGACRDKADYHFNLILLLFSTP
jgi:hypothetical protein